MLISYKPIFNIIQKIKSNCKENNISVVYLSPQGRKLTQNDIKKLARKTELVFLLGKNDGIDKRVVNKLVDYEISIGDYVVNCGDFSVNIFINSISRLILHVDNVEKIMNNTFERKLFGYLNCINYKNELFNIYNKRLVNQSKKKQICIDQIYSNKLKG